MKSSLYSQHLWVDVLYLKSFVTKNDPPVTLHLSASLSRAASQKSWTLQQLKKIVKWIKNRKREKGKEGNRIVQIQVIIIFNCISILGLVFPINRLSQGASASSDDPWLIEVHFIYT